MCRCGLDEKHNETAREALTGCTSPGATPIMRGSPTYTSLSNAPWGVGATLQNLHGTHGAANTKSHEDGY